MRRILTLLVMALLIAAVPQTSFAKVKKTKKTTKTTKTTSKSTQTTSKSTQTTSKKSGNSTSTKSSSTVIQNNSSNYSGICHDQAAFHATEEVKELGMADVLVTNGQYSRYELANSYKEYKFSNAGKLTNSEELKISDIKRNEKGFIISYYDTDNGCNILLEYEYFTMGNGDIRGRLISKTKEFKDKILKYTYGYEENVEFAGYILPSFFLNQQSEYKNGELINEYKVDVRVKGDETSDYNPLAHKIIYLYPAKDEQLTEENMKRMIFFNEFYFEESRNQNPFKEDESKQSSSLSTSSTTATTTPSYNSSSSTSSSTYSSSTSSSTYSAPSYNYSYKPEPKRRFFGFSAGYVQKQWQSKAGGEKEKMGYWDDSKVVHGVQAGFRAEPYFKFGLGLNTGLLYEYYYTKSQPMMVDGYDVYGEMQEHALYMPVHLAYRLKFNDFHIYAFGGVGLDYGISSKVLLKENGSDYVGYDNSPIYETEDAMDWKRFNASYEFGGGLRYKMVELQFTMSRGFLNMSHDSSYKFYQNKPMMLSLGFMF